jgi:hypothetical protein
VQATVLNPILDMCDVKDKYIIFVLMVIEVKKEHVHLNWKKQDAVRI